MGSNWFYPYVVRICISCNISVQHKPYLHRFNCFYKSNSH